MFTHGRGQHLAAVVPGHLKEEEDCDVEAGDCHWTGSLKWLNSR